ncbi:acyl-CoA oxidase [Synchytrium microbalum]|uniref:Acyl-coenzyme A oxidase n=1 Tax=Synchytrium microbalum TaxID=1806994 RepID=A0A507BVI6_9FUNG|nr:acyl-CoA oxidase [Synchytrium microbalum]TPX31171.1 acyl-CoA oxidase [Synchytrium microbalum]
MTDSVISRSARGAPAIARIAQWSNPNNLVPSAPHGVEVLAVERSNATFKVDEMTSILYNKARLERERKVLKVMESEPVFSKRERFFQGRTERFYHAMQMMKRIAVLKKELNWTDEDFGIACELVDQPLPIALHVGMFLPTMRNQTTEEQKKAWLQKCEDFEYIGAYAQTEMGHGSNVQGVETTATYIEETEEFELNSPTLTAAKWWIGSLGRTANHCVLMARLICKGKDYGPHTFFVPLRSLKDHTLLPRVFVMDLGPKMAYQSVDNGTLLFDHYRIPRFNMLAKFSHVTKDGTYVKPKQGEERANYGTMIMVRARMVQAASTTAARAATIAVRYSAIRRQFANPEASAGDQLAKEYQKSSSRPIETAVIDYSSQQYRLFSTIAKAYALHFTGVAMKNLFETFQEGARELLPEVHATSSGLKSFCTTMAIDCIIDMRTSCGGHGYHQFSGMAGFPDFYAIHCRLATVEGDNWVLTQQTTRYLLNVYRTLRQSKGASTSTASANRYIAATFSPDFDARRMTATSDSDLLTPQVLIDAYAYRAGKLVRDLAESIDSGATTFAESLVDVYRLSKAHCQLFVVECFFRNLETLKAKANAEIVKVLTTLANLYALHCMEIELGEFLGSGYVSPKQGDMVRRNVRSLTKDVRPNAVALVDAWVLPDFLLNSSLGRQDGRVYEHMFEWAAEEPLNTGSNWPVVDGYEEYIKPLTTGSAFRKSSPTARL